LDGRLGLGSGAGELGVALRGMDVAEVEESAGMMDRQIDAIAHRNVANIEVAAPIALAVEAGGDLAVGGDADGADERRDRPGDFAVEVEGAVAGGAGWA